MSVAGTVSGMHPITATYYDSTTGTTTTSTAVNQTVSQDNTTTSITASPNPSTPAQNVTFTATVTVIYPGVNDPDGNGHFQRRQHVDRHAGTRSTTSYGSPS